MDGDANDGDDVKIVTMLTDWGDAEYYYVGSAKGVILSICPDAQIVDITHAVPPFDVRTGAHLLRIAAPYFPKGTAHVGVVDPGVGGKRRALAIKTKNYFFLGPDNGLLMPAAEADGIEKIVQITNTRYMAKKVSHTVHGRDVFAPAAAHLVNGVRLEEFGSVVTDPVRAELVKAHVVKGHVEGQIIYIDGFGNVRMNVTGEQMKEAGFQIGDRCEVVIEASLHEMPFGKTFSDVPKEEPLLVVSGSELLEIALNQGNAAKHFRCRVGDRTAVRKL